MKLFVNLELEDPKSGAKVWEEKGFSGETTYRTSGSLAKSEGSAVSSATSDLARRVVARTTEGW